MPDQSRSVSDTVLNAIDATHEIMRVAYEKGDAHMLANDFFTNDAWVVGGEDQTWRGYDGMLSLYDGIVGTYVWTIKREELISLGPTSAMEFLIGTITPHDTEQETLIYKIQLVWVQEGDVWKCASQFFAFGDHFKPA